jgi:Ca2+-binding RTX toxin-like protein
MAGADILYGDAGDDKLWGDGSQGNYADYTPLSDRGNDLLIGAGNANNYLYGGAGSDTLIGGAGVNIMQGDTYGAGTATDAQPLVSVFDYDPAKHKYTYYLKQDNPDGSTSHYNRLGYLDDNGAADTLIGGANKDTIDGELGDDLIELGAGNDIGIGRDGSDTVQGGAGDDLLFGDFNCDASTPDPTLPDWARNAYAGLAGQVHGRDGGDGKGQFVGGGNIYVLSAWQSVTITNNSILAEAA